MSKSRLLGLDFGSKTIGVAVSDPLGIMALGLETIRRDRENAIKPSIRRLTELVGQYEPVDAIVLGFPKNMNNTLGERCTKTLAFKEKLDRNLKGIPVILWDERLSTAGARRTLSGHVQEKMVIDEMAAVFILQGYMDYLKNCNKKEVDQHDRL
ncbi:MAG: Holliday junction resolvase RuvX [Defluviitaleaceae bacterium]|nr:Holliday junction resolvase RuvX [Defluviitaleaceae bacterium]